MRCKNTGKRGYEEDNRYHTRTHLDLNPRGRDAMVIEVPVGEDVFMMTMTMMIVMMMMNYRGSLCSVICFRIDTKEGTKSCN